MYQRHTRSNSLYKGIILTALVLIGLLGWWWFRPYFAPTPEVLPPDVPKSYTPPPPAETSAPAQSAPESGITVPEPGPRPVIRFDEKNPALQALMEERKAEFGLDESIDMIVKPDERLSIGDTVVPMQEILDKIRLQRGGVVEEDLSPSARAREYQNRIAQLYRKLDEAETRFQTLERELSETPAAPGDPDFPEMVREYNELGEVLETYQRYKTVLQEKSAADRTMQAADPRQQIRENIAALKEQREDTLENLRQQVMPEMATPVTPEDEDRLLETLREMEKRYLETEERLKDPALLDDPEAYQALVRERAELRKPVAGFRAYQETLAQIGEQETLLTLDDETLTAELRDRREVLRMTRNDMEDQMITRLLPGLGVHFYGIHVVRPGDNIWDIHFDFLKEYFGSREIRIEPRADEPVRGISTGVGRILKFSENMVYIYNLREQQLDMDLNMIHPRSKIVIFNMGEAFQLLEQIDMRNIHEVRFDGETLWIPAG